MVAFEASQLLESTALFSSSIFSIGPKTFIICNKYALIEIYLINSDLTLKKVTQLRFDDGALAVQVTNSDESVDIHVALASSLVNCYSFDGISDEAVLKWSLNMISAKDHAIFPLSHFQVTSKYWIMGGYRDSVRVLGNPKQPEKEYTIPFNGVLANMRAFEIMDMNIVSLCLQDDMFGGSTFQCWELTEQKPNKIGELPLPDDFITVTNSVTCKDNILLFSENKVIHLKVSDQIKIINQFQVNVKPPNSYSESKTEFSSFSNAWADSDADSFFFFGSTNKGELFHFTYRAGRFIISNIDLSSFQPPNKDGIVFSSLNYAPSLKCLLGFGENEDGAIFAFNSEDKVISFAFSLSNWAPIIDLASCYKKSGIVVATCGNPSNHSTIRRFREGINNRIIIQSDPHFRGCTQLWCLKKFNRDKEHSHVVASFTKSTFVFKIGSENEFEDVSVNTGLELTQPTLAVANSETSSFWIQICPDRIVFVKATQTDRLEQSPPTVWRPSNALFTCACIIRNFIFVYDVNQGKVLVLLPSFQLSQGTAEVQQVYSFECLLENVTSIAAFPISLQEKALEFFIAVGALDGVTISSLKFDENLIPDHHQISNLMSTKSPVNSTIFWRKDGLYYMALGYRNGLADFFLYNSGTFKFLKEFEIGKHPVKFTFVKEESGDQAILCVSKGVWYLEISVESLALLPFHPHIESFTEINLKSSSKIRTFLCTKKETLAILSAELEPRTWLTTQMTGKNIRRLDITSNGQYFISAISSLDSNPEEQNSINLISTSELESILRTKIPAKITTLCKLSRPGYIAVGSVDVYGRGSVHIYSYQLVQDRLIRRRGSLVDNRRQQISSFNFITASSGFSSGVTSVSEFKPGKILVGCDKEIFILQLNYDDSSLSIIRSEPRRYRVHDIASKVTSDGRFLIAICDEKDHVELLQYDSSFGSSLAHVRGDAFGRMASKLCWFDDDRHLVVTDKRGFISVIDVQAENSSWIETVFELPINDIPYGCCPNPLKEGSVLIGTMLGSIYQIDCQ